MIQEVPLQDPLERKFIGDISIKIGRFIFHSMGLKVSTLFNVCSYKQYNYSYGFHNLHHTDEISVTKVIGSFGVIVNCNFQKPTTIFIAENIILLY